MPKYTMQDSSGQLWHDIDDENFSAFMDEYPEAVIVETIEDDDPIEIDSTEVIETQPEVVNREQEYNDMLSKEVEAYNPRTKALIEAFEDTPTEVRSKLSLEDYDNARAGKWDVISEEGKAMMLSNYTFPLKHKGKNDFDSYTNIKANSAINWEAGLNYETNAYSGGYNVVDQFTGGDAAEVGSNLKRFDVDLQKANSKTKEGEIPLHMLDGDLGGTIIGHEEEKVFNTLKNLYQGYGFEFEESESGLDYFTDDLIVRAQNGQEVKIKLDNWTDKGDKEQAAKLKSFLDANKTEYQGQIEFKDIVNSAENLNVQAMQLIKEQGEEKSDWDWASNWVFEDNDVAEQAAVEWRNTYNEDVVKEETKKLDNTIVNLNKEASINQAKVNKFKNEVAVLNSQINSNEISEEAAREKREELKILQQDLVNENERLKNVYEKQVIPTRANLQIIAAKQTIIEQERGSFGGQTANTFLNFYGSIGTYFNLSGLATDETAIREYYEGDPKLAQQIINREISMGTEKLSKDLGADVSNEYEAAFNESVLGGVYTSIVEMASAALPAIATGGAAVVPIMGVSMGAMQAGKALEEMENDPSFDDMSVKERIGYASTVGVVMGTLEAIPFTKVGSKLASPLLKKFAGKGISNEVKKFVLEKVFQKTAGKTLSKAALKRTTLDVIKETFGNKVTNLGKNIFSQGIPEAITEGVQEVGGVALKQIWQANREGNKNLWEGAAVEYNLGQIARASTMGFLAGGGIGTLRGGSKAADKGVMSKLNNNQFSSYKKYMLSKDWQKIMSSSEMINVIDPTKSITKEQAQATLRNYSAQAGILREVGKMGLTLEGEKQAFDLLSRKQVLQKQLDGLTDKAVGKRQREEITSLNEKLENISLNYDFESAYERGLTEASERQTASEKGFNIYKTDKEFEAKMKEFGETDDGGFRTASGYRSGAGDIYINDAAARRLKDISVGQHELLHGVTAKQLEGRGKADKDQIITDFKSELSDKELKVVQDRIDSSYGGDPTTEEYFNAFVDGVVQGDIKYKDTLFTRLGDWVTNNILKPLGFKQASFKNGREAYNFIKGYAKQSKAIAEGTQETFKGDIGKVVSEGVGTKAEGQMSRQTPTVEGVDAKQVQTMIDKVANRAWTRFGKGIPDNIREEAGVTRRSYIDSAKSELAGIATKFDPSKAEFDRYMANTGMQRLNSLAKRLGVKSKEEQTTSIDSDKAQQVEAGQDDFKDTRSEREIRQDERSGVKARTKIPKVYDVDTVVESIREKAKGKDFKGKSIKQLKGFGLKEVVDMIARDDKDLAASIFKKIDKNSDLNKGEMLAIQKFINADADFALNSLLEGYTDDFKATGVVNKILEKFYNKRSVRSKTGPGLNIQIKKPNIDLKEFKEAFGIIGRNMADWNQKVVASKGGVSDILKGFVRNLDQVISSQEIREQKIIEGDLENARKLRSGIPQGFFSKFSKDNQSKTLDEILFDIYGTENIDEVKKFQLFGEALRAQLTTNPDAAIEDLIVAVADQLEIKEGFAYEQVIYDVIQDSISKYKIPGLTVGSGPTEVGGAADIEVNFFGQEVGFEAKKNNARFGSVTASYDIDGNLIIKKDYTFDKLLKQMLKSAKPEIDAYIKEGNKIGKRLFGNKYKPMKNITDAMPAEVYDELKNRGFQKKITQTMKIDTDFVSELYWGKGNGTAYIQIQGLGVFYLKDPSGKNIENPLELDVPPFDGNLDLVFSISSNTANNPSTYDNNDLEVRTKNAKGNPAKRALPGSESFRRISLRFQPSKLTGLEKSSLQLDNPASIKKAFGQLSKQNQITELQQGAFESNQELNESTKVLGKFSRNNQKQLIQEFLTTDAALNKANELNPVSKKIRVFDFDDTLATSNNLVFASNGQETIELNAEEFAKQGDTLIDKGYTMDFSDFNTVRDGNQGPLFDIAKKIKDARGNEDLFVLTARSPEAQVAIYNFLKSQGLEFKMENIVGLGDSTGAAKAQWLIGKAAEGFNDFYFADDAINNVDTVKGAMEVLDVKSRVQLAKEPGKFSKQPKAVRDVLNVVDIKSETQQNRPGKFSKQLDGEFNNIIQETTGEPADSTISDIRAKMAGQNKGKRKFWIPYSAEDFTGLIYPLLGKGKKGNAQMKWFKENLFDPFAKGMAAVSASRLQLMDDFRALKKKLNVPKTLKKKSILGFNNEQAVRAFIWNMQGTKIPGITQKETDALVKHVQNDPTLKTFAYEITQILKGDPYAAPKGDWFAGGIQTDLMETLNTTKRAKYLAQWQANADAIFTKENLNKLEALYGSKYREALENSLARMKNGKNRLSGGNRLSNRILDYINGSVGTIMFLNMRSAILQTISSINFINWTDNNPLKAGAALANQGQYWKDFTTLMQSDFLKDRRSGLRLNINESEIADAAKTGKNKAKAVMSYILQKGYAPTQFADSFAIASGGATFYRNRIKTLLKQGMSKAEAETQAMQDFREIAEASQQSSRPDKISQQQSSDLGRIILAFANTPMQYARLQKRAFQDLVSGRGDAKSNVSKIIYYGFVQNLIFNALQQAVFALGFGDDEEAEEKKAIDTANGMVDSILRGLGIAGVGVSVVKNFLLDIYKRSDRAKPDYVDSVYKLLQFSPPISSKISKIRQAAYQFDSKERRQEMIDKGFSLDNPAYDAFAKVVSAATNAPLDRLLLKMDNVEGALSEENDMWQRVAMLAGWPEWQINPKPKNKEKKTYKRPGYNSLKYKKNKTRSKSKSKLKLKRRI